MRKAVFYGDSNTWGFDPRDFSGGRFGEEIIWTNRLEVLLGNEWEVVNEGMNGRRIPAGEGGYRHIEDLLEKLSPDDLFAVMLGTNDILMSLRPDASGAVRRMDALLERICTRPECPKILLIAPPYIGAANTADPLMHQVHEESVRMDEGFALLAEKYGILFADSSKWDIGIAYDGVHFSEEGHLRFAERLVSFLRVLRLLAFES